MDRLLFHPDPTPGGGNPVPEVPTPEGRLRELLIEVKAGQKRVEDACALILKEFLEAKAKLAPYVPILEKLAARFIDPKTGEPKKAVGFFDFFK